MVVDLTMPPLYASGKRSQRARETTPAREIPPLLYCRTRRPSSPTTRKAPNIKRQSTTRTTAAAAPPPTTTAPNDDTPAAEATATTTPAAEATSSSSSSSNNSDRQYLNQGRPQHGLDVVRLETAILRLGRLPQVLDDLERRRGPEIGLQKRLRHEEQTRVMPTRAPSNKSTY